ncbi:hypothetical protein H8B13_17885 [Hymenobacter sp. BT188]|uniref:hypothetical protein n=1 Tax=Hymenobacter sp. BT188 TaxID=2763504 RepID=UPI0016511A4D|nr:hypothetical protein [Hymenobacter sp. BT188]MBC6608703.1 hypothetical protein [Hymenobacter sp. BT188]
MKPLQPSDLMQRDGRERAVAWALAITQNTPLAPAQREQQLLNQFVAGELSLDAVITLLDEGTEDQKSLPL